MRGKLLDSLPEGWAETTLGSILIKKKGTKPRRLFKTQEPGSVPYIDIKAFETSEFDSYAIPDEAVTVAKGSPLMVWDGSRCGLFGTAPCEGALGSTLVELAMAAEIQPYVGGFLQFSYNVLNSQSRGAGIPHVDSKIFDALRLPLPPLTEQKRIVANLEVAMQEAKATHAKVEDGFAFVRNMREKALTDACSGKLTEDWRGKRTDSGYEDLPQGWQERPLGQILESGGLFDGPFGSHLKKSDYVETGVRVIRLENIGVREFISDKLTFISEEKYTTLVRHTLREGDLLFSSFVSTGVRACLFPKLTTKAIAKADCFCLRPEKAIILPEFLLMELSSERVFKLLTEQIHGVTRPRVNLSNLRELSVRVPPLAEQREILRRYDELIGNAQQFELGLHATRAEAEASAASAMEQAFRGELVPTEASLARAEGREFEDAAALLARIRAEADEEKNAPRPKRIPRAKPMKLTPDSLKQAINAMPAGNFTFTELEREVPVDYNELQKALFKLLEEKQPVIRQVFNKTRKRMELQRVPS